jgi:hypothetical protein
MNGMFTTRNPAEALAFVNSLPFQDFEKAEIVRHFSTITRLMEEMKTSKYVNSKGGERWFASKLETSVKNTQSTLAGMLAGLDAESLMRAQFVASQNAVAISVLELAKECKASDGLLSDLEEYCELMNTLVKKYTGFRE